MDEVNAAVERDINNTLYTVNTNSFVTKRIPSIKTLDDSLKQLEANGKFTGGRWKEYPEANSRPAREKDLYDPFAKILNAIVQTIPEEGILTKIVYVDRHDVSPQSLDPDMADGRPDGAGAQPDGRIIELEEQITEQKNKISLRTRSATEDKKKMDSQHAEEKQELLCSYKLWWMYIHIVYEIKWDKSEGDRFEAVKQLLGYMRLVLSEQMDRRFVLGFVLLYDELTLVSYDRSGVMMTETPINIHADWRMFVRIITGFSCMSPEQLGWDTSMKIYRPPTNIREAEFKPSYEVARKLLDGYKKNGRYKIPWVIDIEQDGKVQRYITVTTISALRSAEVCARATVVYEVVKFDEKENPKKTYALKRYWRPIRPDSNDSMLYPSEGQIYDILDEEQTDEDLKHAIVYHDMHVNGKVDSTFKLIRCNMDVERHQPAAAKPRGSLRTETDDDAELRLDRRDLPEKSPVPYPDPSTLVLVERCHTNILMSMGYEIRAFCCLREVLYCLCDYIEEQRYGHREKLIIHRDISMGNLLIFEDDKKQKGRTFGRLMDYDHAKKACGTCEIPSKISSSNLKEDQDLVRINLKRLCGREAKDDVLDMALKWFNFFDAVKYIENVADLFGLSKDAPLKMEDLGWYNTEDKTKPLSWPNFTSRVAGPGERTGTLAYMSGDVIARETLHKPVGSMKAPPFVHEAIHDVESLLWVVVRLCLTRKGPGLNMRRNEELDEKSSMANPQLRELVARLFDGEPEVLIKTKRELHTDWQLFEEKVIIHFHPYFDPLKPFVLRWWNTLILGYEYRADEFYNIHDHILRIIDEAIKHVETLHEDEQAKEAELERRRILKEHRLGTFSRKAPEMPPVLTSSPELESSMRTPRQRRRSLQQDPDSPTAALSRKMRQRRI